MDSKVNLAVAVQRSLNIELKMDLPRFRLEGWFLQGTGNVNCPKCESAYRIFRCPYTTNKGEYKYWALVCIGCKKATTLDEISAIDKKTLKKWDERGSGGNARNKKESAPARVIKSSVEIPLESRQTKTSSRMQPTDEQVQIIAAVAGGGDIAVNALAGTGKTTQWP